MRCFDCEYLAGRDYETGEPQCDCPDECPYYAAEGSVNMEDTNTGFVLNVDSEIIAKYIKTAVSESILSRVDEKIEAIVAATFKETVRWKTEAALDGFIGRMIQKYMDAPVMTGSAWDDNREEISREAMLGRAIAERLQKMDTERQVKEIVDGAVSKQVTKYVDGLKTAVNAEAQRVFTEATRKALADNVVQMLMNNETYMRLESSVKNLAGVSGVSP